MLLTYILKVPVSSDKEIVSATDTFFKDVIVSQRGLSDVFRKTNVESRERLNPYEIE